MPSRIAQLAEFMEVANRGGGVEARDGMARDRRGTQFDPALVDLLCGERRRSSATSTRSRPGTL